MENLKSRIFKSWYGKLRDRFFSPVVGDYPYQDNPAEDRRMTALYEGKLSPEPDSADVEKVKGNLKIIRNNSTEGNQPPPSLA